MGKCKNCRTPLKKGEKFCGECGQPVPCAKVSGPVRIIIIALVILFLGIIIWSQRMGIAMLTGGKLFGFRMSDITAEEWDGEIEPPTAKEQEKLVAYVEDLQSYSERRLRGDEKDYYQEYIALFVMLTDCAAGDITLDLDTLQEQFNRSLKEVKKEQSLWGKITATVTMDVHAADYDKDIIVDKDAYLAYMLKNAASAMFLQGQDEMALAMASMATSLTPGDSSMSNLVANILKEYGMLDTSYEMLQYALRVNPNDEAALHTLGMLCIDMGEYEEAERCFNRMLRLSGGKGPANQGWMLLALAEGDVHSAYLYMLEAAREGYTHTITEVYEAFKLRSDYFDIAGPIFDQYPLYELVKFERTQQVFDATLDTIDQQVVIDRKLKVCHDAGGSIVAQAENLLEGKRYLEDMVGLIGNNFFGYMSTLKSDLEEALAIFSDPALQSFLNGDGTALLELGAKYGRFEEETNVYTYSYEQEIFFLNILQDYLKYNLEKNEEKYLDAAINKIDTEMEGTPLNDFMNRWREYGEEVEKTVEPMQKWDGVDITTMHQMISYLYDSLPSYQLMIKNFETNGHGLFYGQFTIEQYENLNKAIEEIYPLIEQGYMEQAILCEEYYLYTNNILGYIANDDIYNEWRFYQQLNIQFPLLMYPLAGCMYNEMLALGAMTVFGDAAPIGSADIHIPGTPQFPVTGMGSPTGEPVIIWEFEPPPNDAISIAADELWGEAILSDPSLSGGDGLGEGGEKDPIHGGDQDDAGEGGEKTDGEGTQEPIKPEIYITLDPENNKPAEATTTEEYTIESPTKLKYNLGKLIELNIDPLTGEVSFGSNLILGGGKVSLNSTTGDITLYGHLGPDQNLGVSWGAFEASAIGGKFGGYGRLTINVNEGKITSAEIGADLGATIAGNTIDTEVGYDFATGVRKDTASALVGVIKRTLKTEVK